MPTADPTHSGSLRGIVHETQHPFGHRLHVTLIDQEGNRYSTVGFDELSKSYGNIDLDRRLAEVPPVVRGTYQGGFDERPSALTGSFDKPLTQRVYLPKFAYVVDMIYFPTPPSGVKGRKFELFLDAPELEEPVFVRFEVQS